MFFMNGGGGGPSGGPVDTTLYDLLGVPPGASDEQIKASYKKLAREFHPDKNPQNGEKFKEISYAYEILSNAQRRRMYDMRGLDGIKEGGVSDRGGAGMFPEDLLSHLMGGGGGGLFGGGGGMRGRPRRQKAQDTIHPLKVSLEELYTGKVSKLQITKDVLCPTCHGTGSNRPNAQASQACAGCRGRGIKVTMRQLAPGMMQQMQQVCPDCHGEGTMIADKDKCKKCSGKKTVKQQKVLDVSIPPGSRDGQKIKLAGEGDQEPDVAPGDVIIVVSQKPHELFRRTNADLIIEKTVTLSDALCGYSFSLRHLDGRDLLITTEPGEVLEPGCIRGIPGLGMPKLRQQGTFGTLYIKFDVTFPDSHWADDKTYTHLAKLLPGAKLNKPHGDPEAEEVSLMPFDANKYDGARAGGRREAYHGDEEESDDDEGGMPHGAQRVQCAHQ